MSASAICAPSRPKARASAKPMPLPPPVMKAVLPLNSFISPLAKKKDQRRGRGGCAEYAEMNCAPSARVARQPFLPYLCASSAISVLSFFVRHGAPEALGRGGHVEVYDPERVRNGAHHRG